jgi:hypothetical protein
VYCHVLPLLQVRLAVFSQHHVDGLDLALTPLQYMCKIYPEVGSAVLLMYRSCLAVLCCAVLSAFCQSAEAVATQQCDCCTYAHCSGKNQPLILIEPVSPAPLACPALPAVQVKEEVHRGQLSSFGIPADLAAQPMYTLSGAWWACCGCWG